MYSRILEYIGKGDKKMRTTPTTIRLKNNEIEMLKQIARQMAYNQKKDITYTKLIKDAIYEKYPQIKEV